MSFKGSSEWKAAVFLGERDMHAVAIKDSAARVPYYIKHPNGDWIMFGPQDVRNNKRHYNFALQRLACDQQVRVRVGCRYYTLVQAWNHWSKKARGSRYMSTKNEGKQALAIISLMILQAQAYGLLPRYSVIPFNSSIVKRKK